MLERMIVAIDGSESSVPVLDWCEKATSGTSTEVIIVICHTHRLELGPEANQAIKDELEVTAEEYCARLRSEGIACRVSIVDGDPRLALAEESRRHQADALVVGSRGTP